MNKKEMTKRLIEVLDTQFPKGECKERGHALVLFAEAEYLIGKVKEEELEFLKKLRNNWTNLVKMDNMMDKRIKDEMKHVSTK